MVTSNYSSRVARMHRVEMCAKNASKKTKKIALYSLLFCISYLYLAPHIVTKQKLAFTIARPFEQSHLTTFIRPQALKFTKSEHSFCCTAAGQQCEYAIGKTLFQARAYIWVWPILGVIWQINRACNFPLDTLEGCMMILLFHSPAG